MREKRKPVCISIVGCARCHRNHRGLVFYPLKNTNGFWASCPVTRQPIIRQEEPPAFGTLLSLGHHGDLRTSREGDVPAAVSMGIADVANRAIGRHYIVAGRRIPPNSFVKCGKGGTVVRDRLCTSLTIGTCRLGGEKGTLVEVALK